MYSRYSPQPALRSRDHGSQGTQRARAGSCLHANTKKVQKTPRTSPHRPWLYAGGQRSSELAVWRIGMTGSNDGGLVWGRPGGVVAGDAKKALLKLYGCSFACLVEDCPLCDAAVFFVFFKSDFQEIQRILSSHNVGKAGIRLMNSAMCY